MTTTINVTSESHTLLRQLAQDAGIGAREMFDKVLAIYVKSKGPETRKVTLVIDIDMYKGSTDVVVKVRPYKPWLGRDNADDLQELTSEQADALYPSGGKSKDAKDADVTVKVPDEN